MGFDSSQKYLAVTRKRTTSEHVLKKTILPLASLVLASSAHGVTYLLSGDLDVTQATTNPSNVGNGSGSITGTYDSDSNTIDYTITFADLQAPVTVMHFHTAPVGSTGGVALGIADTSSPSVGTGVLTEGDESDLLGGLWYVNVHTSDFPGGEIRGQVTATVIPEPTSMVFLLGAMGLLGRRRRS
jgi:hypothetical protein